MPDISVLTPDAAGIAALWVSISELAARKGVTKQTISVRVARFEAAGQVTTRVGDGRKKLVNLAEYDRIAGQTLDAVKEQAVQTVRVIRGEALSPSLAPEDAADERRDPTLAQAQTQKALYEAELKRLDVADRRAMVVPVRGPRGVDTAALRCAAEFVRALGRLSSYVDEMVGAVDADRGHGARRVFKKIEHELRDKLGREMAALAAIGQAQEAVGPYEVELPLQDPEPGE